MEIKNYNGSKYIEWADSRPVFTGTSAGEAGKEGSVALISFGGKSYTVPLDINGSFSWTAPEDVADGRYSYAVTIRDRAGNTSAPALRTVIVDTTPPEAPQLLNLYDDAGEHKSSFDPGTPTDDVRPQLTGIAHPGALVYLLNSDGDKIGSALANATSGVWLIIPDRDLASGSNTLRLMAEERFAGELREGALSASFDVVVGRDSVADTATSSSPAEEIPADDAPASAHEINNYKGIQYIEWADSRPVFTGTSAGEAGKEGSVALISFGGKNYTVPLDINGRFSWTAPEDVADGEYSYAVSIRDRAGNVSAPALRSVIVDTTPPAAPQLLNLYDDAGEHKSSFDPGTPTDDVRPQLTGIAQPGALVYLLNSDGGKIGSARADAQSGLWRMEPERDLAEGINSLRLMAEEQFAGKTRVGEPSDAFVITVDISTLPPDTVRISDALDNVAPVTGVLADQALTDDATPTLRGVASAGNAVVVYFRLAGSDVWAGSAVATLSGESWSWTPSPALAWGKYEFQASIGAVSSQLFTLDIASPADIIARTRIDSVFDDVAPDTGFLDSNAITDDATPTFRGSAEAHAVVLLRFTQTGGVANIISVTADATGHWSWTPGTALPAGQWAFEVQAPGETAWHSPFILNITSNGGFAPVIDSALDDSGSLTGERHSGDATDDTTPTLQGRAEANSTVFLRYSDADGNVTLVSFTADAGSRWSWTPPQPLAYGDWTFAVSKSSQSGWGNNFILTLSANADIPAIPVIVDAFDDVGSDTGSRKSGDATDDGNPTLRGTGIPGSIIHIQYGLASAAWKNAGSVMVDASGHWQFDALPLDQDGSWQFRAKAVNNHGESQYSANFILIATGVGEVPIPVLTIVTDNFGPVQKTLVSGEATDDRSPLFSGTAAVGVAFVRLFDGAIEVARVTVVDGRWSWEGSTSQFTTGAHLITLRGENANGKLSADSASFAFNVVGAPGAPAISDAWDDVGVTGVISKDGVTDDNTPTVRGTGQAGSVIHLEYRISNGTWLSVGSVVVASDGSWQLTSPALPYAGTWDYRAKAENGHGESGWSETFWLKYRDPLQPAITDAWDDVGVTGTIAHDGSTDDSTPTLRGTGQAGSLVQLQYRISNQTWMDAGSVRVGSDGMWQITSPLLTSDATWDYRVKAASGDRESAWSDTFWLKFQSAVAPTIDYAWDDVGVTGSLASGDTTNDSTPTLHGRGAANSSIVIRYTRSGGGALSETVNVGTDGSWSWTPPALTSAGYSFEVQRAGESGWSSSFTLTIDPDFDRPARPTISDAWDDVGVTGVISHNGSTDDSTPTLRGTGVAGSVVQVQYRISNETWMDAGSVTVGSNGRWELTSPALTRDATWDYRAKTLTGGGESDWTDTFWFKYQAPQVPGVKGGEDFENNENNKNWKWGESLPSGLKYDSNYSYTLPNGTKYNFNIAPNLSTLVVNNALTIVQIFHPEKTYKTEANRITLSGETGAVKFDAFKIYQNGNKVRFYDKDHNLLNETILNYTGDTGPKNTIFYRAPVGKLISYIDFDLAGQLAPGQSPHPVSGYFFNEFYVDNFLWGNNAINSTSQRQISNEDASILNSTLLLIDENDDNSGYELTRTGSFSEEDDNAADTLALTGKDQLIDLIADSATFEKVHIIDLTGSGDNTIKLDLGALLTYGEQNLLIEDDKIQLVIKGDASDVVQLKDILPEGSALSEWQHLNGTVTVAGVEYQVYSHGNDSELLVQQGVKTEFI